MSVAGPTLGCPLPDGRGSEQRNAERLNRPEPRAQPSSKASPRTPPRGLLLCADRGARDVDTQAIFSLKGKPLNCYGLKRDAIYKNEELYNIMRALGIEDSMDGLRYNRVVIATDADVDGMHIRNLLLTFFLRYFEDLVLKGHVYILETPLFRVRNKKETRYCYSDTERDVALEQLTGPEMTRFKGLGEISPKEFGQFIGEGIRLVQVTVGSMGEVEKSLDFFMGKNTPARKDFIVENLATDVL